MSDNKPRRYAKCPNPLKKSLTITNATLNNLDVNAFKLKKSRPARKDKKKDKKKQERKLPLTCQTKIHPNDIINLNHSF